MRGPNAQKTERSRSLRKVDNDAERLLWFELRGRRLNGLKFVRQLPIGPYFADFACREKMLVVEVDGSQHADSDHDRRRNEFMVLNHWSVARFWSSDVLRDKTVVLETLLAICDRHLTDRTQTFDFSFFPAAT